MAFMSVFHEDPAAPCGAGGPITVVLGGDDMPPALLVGLQGFIVISHCVPEPSTWALIACGIGTALLSRRRSKANEMSGI